MGNVLAGRQGDLQLHGDKQKRANTQIRMACGEHVKKSGKSPINVFVEVRKDTCVPDFSRCTCLFGACKRGVLFAHRYLERRIRETHNAIVLDAGRKHLVVVVELGVLLARECKNPRYNKYTHKHTRENKSSEQRRANMQICKTKDITHTNTHEKMSRTNSGEPSCRSWRDHDSRRNSHQKSAISESDANQTWDQQKNSPATRCSRCL